MKKVLALTTIPLALALALAGCSSTPAADPASPAPSSSSSADASATNLDFNEAASNALESTETIELTDWKINFVALNVDASNQLPELFETPSPSEGNSFAQLMLTFEYTGTGDPVEEIQNLKVLLADQEGNPFSVQGPDELYEALQVGTNLDELAAENFVTSSTFIEVNPETSQFYLLVGEADGDPIFMKVDANVV